MTLHVVSRSGWGARFGRRGRRSIGRVDLVVAHHSYVPDVPANAAAERRACRGIEHYHAVDLGWSAAPGYPWLIGQTGIVYEGVGWWRRGVHTQGVNATSVAFCWLINGDVRTPSDAAWQAAHELVEWGKRIGAIATGYRLHPHHRYAPWKSCCGDLVRDDLTLVHTGVATQPTAGDDVMQLNSGQAVRAAQRWVNAVHAHPRHGNLTADGVRFPVDVDGALGPQTRGGIAAARKALRVPDDKPTDTLDLEDVTVAQMYGIYLGGIADDEAA